jgi:hypothetical protein
MALVPTPPPPSPAEGRGINRRGKSFDDIPTEKMELNTV